MKREVTIIDAMCGAGKTSWAIQEINRNPDGPWLFITPYLDEVSRIIEACPGAGFVEPSGPTKSESLRDLLADSRNIVSTHALFELIDETSIDAIENAGYRLIIDEVPEVLNPIKVPNKEVKMLFHADVLRKGREIAEKIIKVQPGETELGRYDDLIKTAKRDQLVLASDALFFWLFPVRAFEVFRDVTVMTYLYPGSALSCYFRCYDFTVNRMSVAPSGPPRVAPVASTTLPSVDGGYHVVPYDIELERERRASIPVNLYEMPNDKQYDKTALSFTWYSGKHQDAFKRLKSDCYNFLRRMDATSDRVMWTTFKDRKAQVTPNGYAKSFVSCNLRASNGYRKRDVLAYMVNRYLNPTLKDFFRGFNIEMDQDLYALGDFLQWFFRSAIRDGKPVTVWIPSGRMRSLFQDWLNCNI